MRLVTGIAVTAHSVTVLLGGLRTETFVPGLIETCAGLLLIAGLWTPIAGAVVAIAELASSVSSANPLTHVLLATLGAALAMIGPGAWSVDARLFGWRRIDIPGPKA